MSYAEYTLVADTTTPNQDSIQVTHYQLYAAVASQLAAHPAWELVDTVDFVQGILQIYRSFVWRCKAAVSGLPNDFYVIFRTKCHPTTPTTWYAVFNFIMTVAEQYDPVTKVASALATVPGTTAQTLNADATHPATLDLTALPIVNPSTGQPCFAGLYLGQTATKYRLAVLVTADAIVGYGLTPNIATGATTAVAQFYVGAFESLLGSDLDPMPLIVAASGDSTTAQNDINPALGAVGSTRHPGFGGQTGLGFFQFGAGNFDPDSTTFAGSGFAVGPFLDNMTAGNAPTLGTPGETGWAYWFGGAVLSKCCIRTTGLNSSASTHGGVRGFFKYIRCAALPGGVSWGDKFYVDGKLYLSTGKQGMGLLDTTQ